MPHYDAFGNLAAEYSTAQNTSPCTTCYLSFDHLGSVRMLTDGSGNVVARHDYLPFGEEIPAGYAGRGSQYGSTADVDTKFTGQVRDSETGLDDFGARYFGSALGRFTGPDPKSAGVNLGNPQSWNGYSYVWNNPLALVDRNGKWPTSVHNEILGTAFPGLSSSQLGILKTASAWVDSLQNQNPNASNYHSQCAPGQSLDDCTAAINNLVTGEVADAQQLGFNNAGLNVLGYAIHTLTDMTSPFHVAPDGTPTCCVKPTYKFVQDAKFHVAPDGTPTCWGCSMATDVSHLWGEDVVIGILHNNQYGAQVAQGVLNAQAAMAVAFPAQYAAATAGAVRAANNVAYTGLVMATGSINPSTILLNEVSGCLLGNPAACPDEGDSIFQSIMGGGGGAYPTSGTSRHPIF